MMMIVTTMTTVTVEVEAGVEEAIGNESAAIGIDSAAIGIDSAAIGIDSAAIGIDSAAIDGAAEMEADGAIVVAGPKLRVASRSFLTLAVADFCLMYPTDR